MSNAVRDTSNPAERLEVGTVAGLSLLALFDDYHAFGMDVGYRHYLSEGRARPFVGGHAGFVRLETVNADFSVPAANVVPRQRRRRRRSRGRGS